LPTRPRVILADDHAGVTEHLRVLLETEFDVVATVADGEALLAAAEAIEADVFVTDVAMPGLDGISAAVELGRRHPGAKVVIVTVSTDRATIQRGFEAGAVAYVANHVAGEELVPAVRAALKGRIQQRPALALAPSARP
jgi:DNA-binding NarL/FixJ family response regulator